MSVFITIHRPARVAACVLGCVLLLDAAACPQRSGGVASAGDPPTRVARLSAMEGAVAIQAPGSESWTQPSLNSTITTGDRLYAPTGAQAELDMGSTALRLGDAAEVSVTSLSDDDARFGIGSGTVRTTVYQLVPGDSLELDTPNAALVPRAPGSYRVSVDPSRGVTTVSVERGELQLVGRGLDRTLRAGESVQLSGTNPVQLSAVTLENANNLDRWSLARDQRFVTSSPTVRYVGTSVPGWEDLDRYGTWDTDRSYGPVWYPTVVATDWVPYRDGHWAWIDPWGWSWVDDEPWGFAPFHYGRWARFSRGWGWVPGPVERHPVYAPALVMFVDETTLRDPRYPRLQGWFPLAPREPLLPWYRHSDAYLQRVNVVALDRDLRDRDIDRFAWRNRAQAMTAVREETFRGGHPVWRDMVHLRPEQVAGAHLVSRLPARPEPKVAFNGPPARPRMVPPPAPLFERHLPGRSRTEAGEVVPRGPKPPHLPPRSVPGFTPPRVPPMVVPRRPPVHVMRPLSVPPQVQHLPMSPPAVSPHGPPAAPAHATPAAPAHGPPATSPHGTSKGQRGGGPPQKPDKKPGRG